MKPLIIGHGDIGQAIADLIIKNLNIQPEIHDPDKGFTITQNWIKTHPIDVMHVCIPLHDEYIFTREILGYLYDFKPKYCIIHSTILIYTCEQMQYYVKGIPIIHAPIRGNHEDLIKGINHFPLFMGSKYDNIFSDKKLINYLQTLFQVSIIITKSAKETSLAKLLSVIWFGMNIAFTQEAKKICEKHDIDFDMAYTRFFETDNIGKHYKKKDRTIKPELVIPRPIFYPSYIGGKCVIQDVKLLRQHGITKELYDFIIKSNDSFALND